MDRKVLIVDDCDEIREVLAELLMDAGYTVALAAHPDQAADHLQRDHFDVILCDLVMPIEVGQECALVGVSAISKFSKSYPNIPVIAISGELTGGPLNQMSLFGAKKALSKPFTREELLGAIESVVQ
jgi:CheY-like chemotaxis protein